MRVESSPATQSLGHNLLVVRRIFMLILSIVLIASFFASIAASAAENVFKITNTSLVEASQNVEEDFEATDEANISDALLFHRVGDYAKFKITLNNSDSINHTIESITDDNDNEYIALEYADYAGTAVNSGDSFDFLLTIKYTAAVDDINNRDQISNFKLFIKYAESEKPDEIDPSSPDTSDNFKVAITILVISATGLLICLVKAKRIDHRVTKTIAVIALVVSPFVISNNAQAASEGTDVLIFTGEYHLYDQLVITLDNGGTESTIIVNYNTTVGSITKPTAPNGYEFDTWKDKDGNPISDSTKLTEDTKLFAGYKIINYTIYYTGLTTAESANYTKEYTVETGSISLTNPANRDDADEHFVEWTSSDVDVSDPTNISLEGLHKDITITANWEANTHNLGIDLNGGTTAQANPTTFTKETDTFTLIEPTKNGYEFKGWSGTGLSGDSNKNVKVEKGTKRDLDFEAHYTAINYSINYTNVNDNEKAAKELPESYTIETAKTIAKLDDRFDSDGDKTQRFVGWQTEGQSGTSETVSIPLGTTGNKSYTAIWENVDLPSYNITYTLNEGTNDDNNPANYNKNDLPLTINQPTREYYTFVGWTSEALGITVPQKNVTIPSGTKANITLTANWTPVEYSIGYTNVTDNEKTTKELPESYTIETAKTIAKLDNRKDEQQDETEKFIGWQAEGSTEITETVTIPAGTTGNKKYTAVWQHVDYPSYGITYAGLEGATDPGNKTSYKKTDPDYTLTNPTKTGYNFDGWTCDQLEVSTATTNFVIPQGTRGALTIEAHFSAIEYQINYTGVTEAEKAALTKTYTINDEVTINALNDHKDEDGDITEFFVGWSNGSGSDPVSTVSFSNQTGNKSYEAIWQNNENYPPVYSITYNLDGGIVSSNPASYTKQDSNFTLNNPSKTGYNFTGWSGSHLTGEANTEVTVQTSWKEALEFTAHYSPIQYNVSFAINAPVATDENDTTSMESLACTYGTACTLPNNTLVLVGYTFNGWNTQADGNGTAYADGANITNLRDTAGEVTLYAQWTPKDVPYTIQFYFENINDDDFTIDDSKTIDNLSGTANTTASVDPANYTFDHFTYTSNQSVTESNIDRHGSTILKLYYTRNTYNITFNANGGTISGAEIFEDMKYGATISKDDFPTATQSGSDFAGWFTEADGGQKITDDITVEGTDTIYAHWTPSEVTLCKKATELHIETCRNNAGGCKNTGYTVMNYSTDPPTVATVGTKGTSDIVYGNISDGDSVQKGDAFDCDVNGDGDYDSNTERFYYIRSTDDKAILIYSNNFQDGAPGYTNNYNYDPAIAQLPTTQQWTALTDVATTYDNNRIARFLNIEDFSSACDITSLSDNQAFPETCSFMLENTSYFAPNDAIAKSGIWTEATNGDDSKAFRIHSSTLKFTYMGKNGSKNVARPIIEIPIDQLDTSDVEMVTISFNTQGGNTLESFDMGKGNPLRFREQDYTPTRAGHTFKGWCLDSDCETEPNYSTIINNDTTLYAKWEEMDTVAAIGSTGYPSLAAAIAAVPTTGEATEVILLKSTSESTITTSAGQNIVLNLQDETFTTTNKNALQLSDGSKLKLVSGTIKSSQNDGAINVNQGSEFEMTGGTIDVSGKQALYVNGGTATISGGNIISTSTQRAAIHNQCDSKNTPACTNITGGVINILGGTIQSTKGIAIKNEKGTLNIGTHDGHVEASTPHIIGKTIGVVAGSSFRFYDGTIEGETWPVGTNDTTPDTNYTKIAGIETDSELIKDHESTPKKIYLAPTTGTGQ